MTVHCGCLHEEPQGIRPGPNAPVRIEADPKCSHCGGEGKVSYTTYYDPKPVPFRGGDWEAIPDGSETGPVGYGATKAEAIRDLEIRLQEVCS